jgi:hypothetical protein
MTNNRVVHYEVLWERAEEVAATKHPNTTDAIKQLSSLIKDLSAIHQTALDNPKSEIAQSLKAKAIGQVLFLLTSISAHEKIDVYLALKNEYELSLFQDQLQLKLDGVQNALENLTTSNDGASTDGSLASSS